MNLSDSLAALTVANVDVAQPDVEDVTQRLKRLMDLERLVAEQSAELAWTNERLVAELYDRSAVEASANHLERYDLVTGLPNRRSLEERMSRVLSPLDSTQEPAAVIMVGFERLAEVRETLGYTAGDFVARQVADRLRLTVRGSDLVARVGDDEFALLLTSLRQADDAGLLARKLYSALVAPLVVAGRELRLEPAVGVAVFPQDGHNGDLLLARADGAMRFAREHRTGLTQFFRPEIALRAARRLSVEADLRAALERDQFRVHFQPRFDLATGRLIGAEALVRWQHPERGVLGPAEFLDVAEDTGLIVPIGEVVLARTGAAVAEWDRQGAADALPLSIAINLSTHEFRGRSMLDHLDRMLGEHALAPQRLQVEISESGLARSLDVVDAAALAGLREMGVRVALEGFGAGAASFALLRRFSFDALKIDGQFVREAPHNERDAAIVQTIVDLGHRLGLTVVAAGVETAPQLAAVSQLGCDEAQGYLLGVPVPADQFARVLASARVLATQRRPRRKPRARTR